MLALNKLDVDEIATALADPGNFEHVWLIDPRTGELSFWTSDIGIDGSNPIEFDQLDLLQIPDLVPVWQAFRDARAKSRAVEWLLDQGLVHETGARRFVLDHPEATLSLSKPRHN